MRLVNHTEVRRIAHSKGKIIQRDALHALERRVLAILESAISNARHFKTIRSIDVELAKSKSDVHTSGTI
jgi:histone H3/H4